jgi:uncharacterized protein YdaU (DUF1376 family)
VGKTGKAPAFQCYAADLLTDTAEYTNEEFGAYFRLLCYQFINGSLPKENHRLAVICTASPEGMEEMWLVFGHKFELGTDGRMRNPRMEETRREQEEYRNERELAGKKGAASRWQTDSLANGTVNSSANGKTMALQSSPSPSENLTTETLPVAEVTVKIRPPSDAELVYMEYPRKENPRKAKEAIGAAIKRLAKGEEGPGEMSKDDAVVWLIQRTKLYGKSPRGRAGANPPKGTPPTPYPQGWFNGSRYLEDESIWFAGATIDDRPKQAGINRESTPTQQSVTDQEFRQNLEWLRGKKASGKKLTPWEEQLLVDGAAKAAKA